jgi:hypothetical protein
MQLQILPLRVRMTAGVMVMTAFVVVRPEEPVRRLRAVGRQLRK